MVDKLELEVALHCRNEFHYSQLALNLCLEIVCLSMSDMKNAIWHFQTNRCY